MKTTFHPFPKSHCLLPVENLQYAGLLTIKILYFVEKIDEDKLYLLSLTDIKNQHFFCKISDQLSSGLRP